jgi:hypothetical protein
MGILASAVYRRGLLNACKMRPHEIEDPEGVDERRHAVGLEPLAEVLARAKPQPLPADRERFERDYQKWLIEVGWRRRSEPNKGSA